MEKNCAASTRKKRSENKMPEKKEVIESTLYNGKVAVRFFPDSHIYMVNGKRAMGATTFINIKDKSKPLMSWKGQRTVDFLLKELKKGHITEELICAASYIDEIEKEEAAGFGSKIHGWCEQYIKSKLNKHVEMPEFPEEKQVQVGVNAFLDWEKEHEVKFVSSERMVYSKKYGYMGTLDIEAKIDGKLCLVDLKSSNGLYNSVNMQTAAYVMADQEESDRKYKGRWAIRLSKYDQQEYEERERQKKYIKKLVANYRGNEAKEYPISPYEVFEAKFLDEKEGQLEYDFAAFLACMKLYKWDADTDYWKNK